MTDNRTTDDIAQAEDMAREIKEKVLIPLQREGEELATWIVEEYKRVFEENPDTIVKVNVDRRHSHRAVEIATKLLEAKHWYVSDNYDGTFSVGPNSGYYDKKVEPDQEAIDRIPRAESMAGEIRQKVLIPRERKAEELSAWMIQEALRLFAIEPDDHVIVQAEEEVPHYLTEKIEKILQSRGWYFSRWENNQFWISPNSAAKLAAGD